jgi:hypothetical protein
MALRLIGAGWGRTGTASLHAALDTLGLHSHHMVEVFQHPEQAEAFARAAQGDADWDAIYAGYDATVDWPGAAFWRELADHYPDAKVLLSVRDPAKWYESFRETIYMPLTAPDDGDWAGMVRAVILERDLEGNPHDRDHVIDAFERHNAEVIATIPADRLLVYEVSEGWAPVCAFLDVPVPDDPFPHTNDRAAFLAMSAVADPSE